MITCSTYPPYRVFRRLETSGSGLTWQGNSRATGGHTLFADVTTTKAYWLDNAGNFFSDPLHVVERSRARPGHDPLQPTARTRAVYTAPVRWSLCPHAEQGPVSSVGAGVPRGDQSSRLNFTCVKPY